MNPETVESHHTKFPPLNTDKLVLFDLDGTLIDSNYTVTDESVYDAIAEAQNEGWTVGLSSDTPYDVLVRWHQRFGMNGPIVAEKGAHVVINHHLVSDDHSEQFSILNNALLESFQEAGARTWNDGDPVQHLREERVFGAPGEVVTLVNPYRRFSASFFVRFINEAEQYVKDEKLTEQFVKIARTRYVSTAGYDEDINYQHGLMIVSEAGMSKRTGSLVLRNLLGVDRFVMIGNSGADYIGSDIAVHLAVGDATPELKKVADYIVEGTITTGATMALRKLMEANR